MSPRLKTEAAIECGILESEYGFGGPLKPVDGDRGMNNTTVMFADGPSQYVMRIYNNHRDRDAALLEHEVLTLLRGRSPGFQVPEPVPNRQGDTVTIMPDGALAAVFRYIDGERPSPANPEHVASLGTAAGRLSREMGSLRPKRKPIYDPYYTIGLTYAALDEEAVGRTAASAETLAAREDSFRLLQRARRETERRCGEIAELPKQWIHGDLVFHNALCKGGSIVGLLDFEFATVDVRAMELAVVAVDALKPELSGHAGRIGELAERFMSEVKLGQKELALLPYLMRLRIIDVALHFIGRYREGLDDAGVLGGIMDGAAYGLQWLEGGDSKLFQL